MYMHVCLYTRAMCILLGVFWEFLGLSLPPPIVFYKQPVVGLLSAQAMYRTVMMSQLYFFKENGFTKAFGAHSDLRPLHLLKNIFT